MITWASNSLSPEAVLQFTDSDHSSIESEEVISPLVQLLTNIATDLTVAAIPVNYTVLNDSQSHILGALPDVPDYNRNRPINARSKLISYQCKKEVYRFFSTGFPIEDRDFNSSPVYITFPAGNAAVRRIDIGIVDDEIHEVEQIFVVFLRVVDAVNQSRVDLRSGRFATLGRIFDDDGKGESGVTLEGHTE